MMNQRPAATTPSNLEPIATDSSSAESPDTRAAEKKWQIDRASGVPVPVIRANMISLRLSYQGRVKVAFFDQD